MNAQVKKVKDVPGLRLKCVETKAKTRIPANIKPADVEGVAKALAKRSHPNLTVVCFRTLAGSHFSATLRDISVSKEQKEGDRPDPNKMRP